MAAKKKRRKKKASHLQTPSWGTDLANRIGKKKRSKKKRASVRDANERAETRALMDELVRPHLERGAGPGKKKRRGGIGGLSLFEAELVALQSTLRTIRALQVLGWESQRRVYAAVQEMLDDGE